MPTAHGLVTAVRHLGFFGGTLGDVAALVAVWVALGPAC
jgi:hypothetical protein